MANIFGSALGGQAPWCAPCNSFSCHHLLGAQQQMQQNQLADYYNQMLRMSNASTISVANAGNILVSNGTNHVIQEAISPKKPNKKLLLLPR